MMEKINTNELARMIADDLTEMLKVKGRKTVPRQTNVPLGVSEGAGKPQEDDGVYLSLGKPIYNPLEGAFMSTPKIGDKVYMVVPTTAGLIVVVDEFRGTELELLMLAQRRLFMYKEEAVSYKMKCEAIIAAMKAQLAD